MTKYILILIGLAHITFLTGQNVTINPAIKEQNGVNFIRSGGFIYEVNNKEAKYFAFGWFSDEVHKHDDLTDCLNFDIKGSLMITLEYVNHKVNQPNWPNRLGLVLKHPSFGDPAWRRDLAKFSIKEYLPENLGKFYYDILIIDSTTYNFFLLHQGSLKVYEIKMNNGFQGILSFKLKQDIPTKIKAYFNVVYNSETNKQYVYARGEYFEVAKKGLVKKGAYDFEDFVILDSKNKSGYLFKKQVVIDLVDEVRSGDIETMIDGKHVIDRSVELKALKQLNPIKEINY